MRKVWGLKRWSQFGKGGHAKRTLTNIAPSAEVMRYAAAAAAGEYKNKGALISGRILLNDQARGDGFWDLAAIRTISKKV